MNALVQLEFLAYSCARILTCSLFFLLLFSSSLHSLSVISILVWVTGLAACWNGDADVELSSVFYFLSLLDNRGISINSKSFINFSIFKSPIISSKSELEADITNCLRLSAELTEDWLVDMESKVQSSYSRELNICLSHSNGISKL